MSFSKLLKKLKRHLRRKRRMLSLAIWFLLAGATLFTWFIHEQGGSKLNFEVQHAKEAISTSVGLDIVTKGHQEKNNRVLDQILKDGADRVVFVQKQFICGLETQQIGQLNPQQISLLHEQNPEWELTINDASEVYFIDKIEDLSAKCKDNAYFGVDKNGNLSLFEGLPSEDNIIRTFFQLNIDYLETSLPKGTVDQLYDGIRINDLAEYNSVLSTFSDYAVNAQEVMKNGSP